ncbi:MAG: sugar transferase [Bacteroidetes bacterium]|nr:sugar transferase [Bacteroidota bacterium]
MAKRLFDLAVAVAGLVLLAPFFLIIALLIKANSEGPVFYLQERVGLNGTIFKLFKFRTMKVNADKGNAITVGSRDPRITTVGYFLRKFKLDELPQLINVAKGDMSLVGPRPELKKFVDMYDNQQRTVLSVRPGITDYASIQFRNENELLEGKPDPIQYYITDILPLKLKLNQQYIRDQSLWVDLRIILKTVFLIFRH